eukprot:5191069-Heterocapsa_arctica.AAC.1
MTRASNKFVWLCSAGGLACLCGDTFRFGTTWHWCLAMAKADDVKFMIDIEPDVIENDIEPDVIENATESVGQYEMYVMSGLESDAGSYSSSRRRHRSHTGRYYLSDHLFENGFLPFLSNSENGYLQRLCHEASTLSITVPFLTIFLI